MRMIAAVVLMGLACGMAWASKPRSNFSYVQSGPDGVFYARCVPDEAEGTRGTTKVYRVGKQRDDLVDGYDWYVRPGVVLGWSPIAGKVAIMALGGPPAPGSDTPPELSFHLGGERLASYTAVDLKEWGAEIMRRNSSGEERADFKVVGCEQVPGTNDYRFVIEIKGNPLSFDILTGKPPAR